MSASSTLSILVVRLSALGDVVMAAAAVRGLQEALPEAHISWLISRPAYKLLEGMQGIHFIVIDKPASLLDYVVLKKQLANNEYDICLAMQANLRTNLIYPLVHAQRKIGFDRLRAKDLHRLFVSESIAFQNNHIAEGFLQFVRYLGIPNAQLTWGLPIDEVDREWAQAQRPKAGKLIVINPCASKAERNWPIDHWIDLIHWLMTRWLCDVVITGGLSSAERKVAKMILDVTDARSLVGETSPKQLAALIEQADCLIAPDTGPVHMAVAVETPVVGLYAVAPSKLTGPYGAMEFCVDRYDEAVRALLQREPAAMPWGARVHHADAMRLITVADVQAQIEQVFS